MTPQKLDSMEAEELAWALHEPFASQLRGKSPAVKKEALAQLTPGQRALFMFQVLYQHTQPGAPEYYCWVSDQLRQVPTWSAIKQAMRFFEDEVMLQVLEDTERVLADRDSLQEPSVLDMEQDAALRGAIEPLDRRFRAAAPETFRKMALYIRSHPTEFIQLQD